MTVGFCTVNETLCKLVCHNLAVLIHEMHELGIDPTDWGAIRFLGRPR